MSSYLLDTTLDASRTDAPTTGTLAVTTNSTITVPLSGDGTYILTIWAEDLAGNVSVSSSLTLQRKTTVQPDVENHFLIRDGSSIMIPAGSVTRATRLSLTIPSILPISAFQSSRLKMSRKALDFKLEDGTSKFLKAIILTMTYAPEDIAGLMENRLSLAYFDESKSIWIPITGSQVIATRKMIVASVDHFTLFGIVELVPNGNALQEAYNFPNPFSPSKGTTIRYVLGDVVQSVTIKLYRFNGGLIRELTGTTQADVNNVWWDGKDRHGQTLFSEVVVAIIEAVKTNGEKARKTIKMAGWQ